jgi:hypothetical protein
MATTSYPRIPESNWWKLRDQFKKTLPGSVTPAYLRSLLGLNSEKAAQNLIGPLRQLGLIDEDNKPAPRANDWRNDAKYAEVCRAILEEVYPAELIDLYSGPGLDRQAVQAWFMHNAALGEGAAGQNAQLYLILNDAQPQPSTEQKRSEARPSKAKPGRNVPAAAAEVASSAGSTIPVQGGEGVGARSANGAPTVHIDLQIHISPDAKPDQIEAIFASMARHLYSK